MRWNPSRLERLEQAAKRRRSADAQPYLLVVPDEDRDVVRPDVWAKSTNIMVQSEADRRRAELVARGVTPPLQIHFGGKEMNC